MPSWRQPELTPKDIVFMLVKAPLVATAVTIVLAATVRIVWPAIAAGVAIALVGAGIVVRRAARPRSSRRA